MVCKRRLHRLRSHNWVAVAVGALLFLGILVTYTTLTGHDAAARLGSYLPTHDGPRAGDSGTGPSPLAAEAAVGVGVGGVKSLLEAPAKRVLMTAAKKPDPLREVVGLLYPRAWRSAMEADEMALVLKDRLLALNLSSPMTCGDIGRHQLQGTLSYSPRKLVERLDLPRGSRDNNAYGGAGAYGGQPRGPPPPPMVMVVKSQSQDPQTRALCQRDVGGDGVDAARACHTASGYLLLREVFLLRALVHPNLIGVLGYCLRGDAVSHTLAQKGVVLVMEMGQPFIPTLSSSLAWPRRVQLAHGLASLLAYLQSSPLGSVGLPGVKPKDIVLVNDRILKLTDLDDAQLDEKACHAQPDCFLENVDVGVACSGGRCRGLNQKTNLRMLGGPLLVPLLQGAPNDDGQQVETTLNRVRHLNISAAELLAFMDTLVEKYSPSLKKSADSERHEPPDSKKHPESNGHSATVRETSNARSAGSEVTQRYRRVNSSNLPSQHDYPCPKSRVHWGCVLVVENVLAAMEWCSADVACRAFVVFSTHPDDNSKVAVVFKNSNSGPPMSSSGTTLYLLQDGIPLPHPQAQATPPELRGAADDSVGGGARGRRQASAPGVPSDSAAAAAAHIAAAGAGQRDGREERQRTAREAPVKADPWVKVKETAACLLQGRDSHEETLHIREKRIMTAMGMKGMPESDWRQAVQVEKVVSFSDVVAVTSAGSEDGVQGGSMVVHFSAVSPGQDVQEAVFMAEKGPTQNHVAFALLYTLDRLLGLYHVPPTVEGFLHGPVVSHFAKDQSWQSLFGPLTHPDGTLRGLFVARTPKSLRAAGLSLVALDTVPAQVQPLSHTQQRQLEYVLLWWMAHLAKANNTHLGVKGHLVHVDGDSGFQDVGASYEGFLYHCQFPSLLYSMLSCFRCALPDASICLLGQEVVRRVTEAGFKLSDLAIPGLTERDYPKLINEAASQVIQIVDSCVRRFGQDTVLY